jgi:hypothetical protein
MAQSLERSDRNMLPKTAVRMIAYTFLAMILAALLISPLLGNAWLLLIGRGYFIPVDSSIFTFEPIEMNNGSGEWWIYGQDYRYYYYAGDGVGKHRYRFVHGSQANECRGFVVTDFSTWCDLQP